MLTIRQRRELELEAAVQPSSLERGMALQQQLVAETRAGVR